MSDQRERGNSPSGSSICLDGRSMFAEDFLELLAEKNLVSSEFLDGLRSRLAQKPRGISAELFADRLVREGVLTASLAEALLRQLERHQPPVASHVPSPPPPPIPPSSHTASAPAPNSPTEPVLPDRHWKEGFSRKKRPKNPWDTKLILFGVAGLFLLVLAGVFLTGSLSRRGAETMYASANGMYEKGNYSKAIADYTEYLAAFPNHSGAPTARIRRALARIRLLVDAGTDWSKAFETAETEIDAVKDEPVFFDESKAELAVLLPKIAISLAAEAKEKTSILHAERGQRALDLIDELLPRSLRPVEKLAEAKFQIDGVRRLLIRNDAMEETRKQLADFLETSPFDAAQVARCIEALDSLADRYPELENEKKFLDLAHRFSETESRAVRTIPIETLDEMLFERKQEANGVPPLAVLYHRTLNKKAPVESMPLLIYAAETIFALNPFDGAPLWRKRRALPENSPPPKIVQWASSDALVIDSNAWRIDRLDTETGNTTWSFSVGEPFFLSEPVVDDRTRSAVAASTVSGRVLLFDFGPETKIRVFRLPRRVDSPPVVDRVGKRVFQFADRATLFSLPLEASGEIRSYFTNHKPGTLRGAPVLFGENLIFARQTGVRNSESVVFSTEKGVLQRFPIRGLVDTPIARNETHLALVSDDGETSLWERTDDPDQPLKLVAQGSAGVAADRQGVTRHAVLDGKTVWIADRHLMRFETQLAQSRLFPKDSVIRNIVTTVAPFRSGRTLLHTFRQPELGGTSVEAVSLDDAAVFWETEIADPIVLEPRFDPESPDSVTVYTSTGRSYRIGLNSDEHSARFLGTPVDRLQRGIFAGHPLGRIVPLRDGFAAWIPRVDSKKVERNVSEPASGNRLLMIFDPEAPASTRFKSLLLSIPFAAPAAALDGNLLIPLADGRIVSVDPKTREPAAAPFVPPFSETKIPRWSEPVVDAGSKEAFLVDNAPDSVALFWIVPHAKDGRTSLVSRFRLPLEQPVDLPPVVSGNNIVLIDRRNTLHVVACGKDDMKIAFSEPQAAACVWGPHAAAGRVFWAAADAKLHSLGADLKRTSIASPIPAGKPFSDENGILLNSATGTLWSVEPDSMKIRFTLETGVKTSTGPVRAGGRILVSGRDGAVYDFNENELRSAGADGEPND